MSPLQNFFAFRGPVGNAAEVVRNFLTVSLAIKPIGIANLIRNTLICLCIFSLLYVFLTINGLPLPQFFDRPVQMYQFQILVTMFQLQEHKQYGQQVQQLTH